MTLQSWPYKQSSLLELLAFCVSYLISLCNLHSLNFHALSAYYRNTCYSCLLLPQELVIMTGFVNESYQEFISYNTEESILTSTKVSKCEA